MVSLVFFLILQLPLTVISNSEKLTHPNMQLLRKWAHETLIMKKKKKRSRISRYCEQIGFYLNNNFNKYHKIVFRFSTFNPMPAGSHTVAP